MSEIQQIQWFPGHMTRTKRQIQASLGLVDAVAEIIDARVPQSSRNPDLNKLVAGKPRVVLLISAIWRIRMKPQNGWLILKRNKQPL